MDGAVEFVKHRWTRWHTLFAIILIAGLSFLHGKTHVELKRSRAGPCALQFKRYVPSEWEEYWLVNKKQIAPKICEVLKANDSASGVWIDSLAEAWNLDHPIDERVQQTFADASHVFSTYEYVDTCSGKQVNVPVEPLVGLLRHPWVVPGCRAAGRAAQIDIRHSSSSQLASIQQRMAAAARKGKAGKKDPGPPGQHIENKGHQLMLPMTPEQVQRYYPGRKYLFDLGTGTWKSGSLMWFHQWYGHRGIEFDEIWGWEMKVITPKGYWDQFLPKLTGAMHFYDVGVNTDPDDERNPFNIIRKIYRPGDFIAFKLDIDHEPTEQALMSQLDGFLSEVISEFFFEEHYFDKIMQPWFLHPDRTWTDTVQHFHDLRSSGLRLHYWP